MHVCVIKLKNIEFKVTKYYIILNYDIIIIFGAYLSINLVSKNNTFIKFIKII